MNPNHRVGILGAGPLAAVVAACSAQVYSTIGIGPVPTAEFTYTEPFLQPRLNYGTSIGTLTWGEPEAPLDVLWLCPEPVLIDEKPDLVTLADELSLAIADYAKPATLVLLSADVPIGFSKHLQTAARHSRLAYVAELLQRGRAVEGFENPDRIIVGYDFDPTLSLSLKSFFSPWSSHLIETGFREAELSKLAVSAYLVAIGALTNELAEVCGAHGIDPREVEVAVRTDQRFGYGLPLSAGPPVRSAQLLRDLRYLEERSVAEAAPLLHAIARSNRRRLT